MSVDAAAGELYGVAPEDFIARRAALAKEAKAAGDKELSAAIAKLRKPSTAAWALNVTARADAKAFDGVLALGGELRAAQRELDADRLRMLMRRRHEVVGAATGTVRAVAEALDRPLSESVAAEVDAALHAALGDEQFAASIVAGALVTAVPGDVPALGVDLAAAPKRKAESPATKPNKALLKAEAALREAQARADHLAERRAELERQVATITGQLGTIVADELRVAKALDAARTAVQAATRRR